MPFGLGFFATAGAGAAGSFDLLESQVLSSNTASITFSSLSTYASTYQHLQIRFTARSTNSGTTSGGMRFNSDSGNNYALHSLEGNGSAVFSGASTSQNNMLLMVGGVPGASAASGLFCAGVFDILDPFETTKNKTVKALQGFATGGPIRLNSGLWINTSALTSANLFPSLGDWLTGSRFSLYGIKAA